MQTIEISVIIPCFNVEKYIAESIETVLKQFYPPVDIICVDDGSTDGTISIIENLMIVHPGVISLLKNDGNKGAPFSRNRGMAAAKGNYLQFLDADDLLFENKFEHQAKILQSTETLPDILVGSFTKTFLNGNKKEYINSKVDMWVALIDNRIGVTSANLFKKSKVEEVGGWSEYLKSSQEYDLMFRMLQKGATVIFDTLRVNINRERPSGSITKSNPREKWKRYINLRIRIYNYLLTTGELTEAREQAFIYNLFNAVRTLYMYDRETALEYYNQYLRGKKLSDNLSNINTTYRFFYHLLGLDLTQKISLFVKGEKVNET
jgi:glycosyltransferase involved in cell wall biosynthesis